MEINYKNLWQQLDSFFSKYPLNKYKKKDLIFETLGASENVFFVKSGYVRVFRVNEDGEELTLTILKANDFFPLTLGGTYLMNYSLEALTSLEIYKAPREHFLNFVQAHPPIFYDLITFISMRLGGLLARIEFLVTGHAHSKVAAAVLACARRFGSERGSSIVVDLPLTHKDIATFVGITRETACLEMKKLERKGLIAHEKRILIVKDISGLEHESLVETEERLLLNNSL